MKNNELAIYLKESSILVIEGSTDSSDNLINQLVQLGADFKNIHSCRNKEEAQVFIDGMNFEIIFSEYSQISSKGFELFKLAKQKMGNTLLTFVLTSNNSQITVATSAEEEVSDYLLKPVSFKNLQIVLTGNLQILKNKNKYLEKITLGKAELKLDNLANAERFFEDAESLHEAPSLACYYLGQVSFKKGDKMAEVAHYNRGLKYNAYHYHCLCAVMEFYRNENRFDLSFKILKRLVEFFPASNERLCMAVHTSIRLEKFDEIRDFYKTYAQISEISLELQKHIEAGLYILAKYKVITHKYDEAELWLKEICNISTKREYYLTHLSIAMNIYWDKNIIDKILFNLNSTFLENKICPEEIFLPINLIVKAA